MTQPARLPFGGPVFLSHTGGRSPNPPSRPQAKWGCIASRGLGLMPQRVAGGQRPPVLAAEARVSKGQSPLVPAAKANRPLAVFRDRSCGTDTA